MDPERKLASLTTRSAGWSLVPGGHGRETWEDRISLLKMPDAEASLLRWIWCDDASGMVHALAYIACRVEGLAQLREWKCDRVTLALGMEAALFSVVLEARGGFPASSRGLAKAMEVPDKTYRRLWKEIIEGPVMDIARQLLASANRQLEENEHRMRVSA